MSTAIGYVAKAIVRRPGGACLLLVRSQTDLHRPGDFDLPGGGVEADERIEEAVLRELTEETGLLSSSRPVLLRADTMHYGADHFDNQPRDVVRFLYLVEVADDVVSISEEHEGYEWTDMADLSMKLSHTRWGEMLAAAAKTDYFV